MAFSRWLLELDVAVSLTMRNPARKWIMDSGNVFWGREELRTLKTLALPGFVWVKGPIQVVS